MIAMQYVINLPEDYDMKTIHERVESRRHLFNGLEGLRHKSYLINEKERIYAPFYIWHNIDAAKDFLINDLFKGVSDSFNRPRVRMWMVLSHFAISENAQCKFAMMESDAIAIDDSIEELIAQEKIRQNELFKRENAPIMHLLALDSDRWELVKYSLWRDKEDAGKSLSDSVVGYDVMYVSGISSKLNKDELLKIV